MLFQERSQVAHLHASARSTSHTPFADSARAKPKNNPPPDEPMITVAYSIN